MESRIITLFADPTPSRRGPSGFFVSVVVHIVVMGSLYLNLKSRVRVEDAAAAQRYTVRLLSLWRPEPKIRRPVDSSIQAPRSTAGEVASGGQPSAPSLPQQPKDWLPAPQTIVQPDLPPNLLLRQEVPVPSLLIWSPENSTAKMVLPPPPQQATAGNVRPDLSPPNHELTPADLKLSANAFVTDNRLALPSTTSPVTVRGPEAVQQAAETTSKPLGTPVPARVLSLSDLRLERGTIALPLINEIAVVGAPGALAPAREVNPSKEGNGNGAGKQNGIGAGPTYAGQAGGGVGQDNPAGRESGTGRTDTAANPPVDDGSDAQHTVTRIVMPKDGKFGVVVVGSSMAEEYPETLGLWGSRMAYTVYLHVGSAKSWILQYSLPPAASAAENGTVVQLQAPWPFVMERPELAPGDLDGDAILVHGFVNESGHFEKLTVAFPVDFAQSKFVLGALQKWQFRAAMQNGLLTAVEVLLIIPAAGE